MEKKVTYPYTCISSSKATLANASTGWMFCSLVLHDEKMMSNYKQPITDPVTADCRQILRSASRLEQQSDVDGLSAQWDARGGEYDIESDLKGINGTTWQNGPGSVNTPSENRAEPCRSPVRLSAEGFPAHSLSAIRFCRLCASLAFPSVGTKCSDA